jgi:UDP-glucose 4-epimerase
LSVFSPHLVTLNTFSATTSVLSAGIKNRISRFVYLSSMARYGTQESFPFKEDMEPKPQDPYGIAKYASELSIKNLCEMHGIEYVISVPHNIIGPRQKYDDPFRNVASIMINLMLQGRQPFIYGDGEQKRCFSFINDVTDPLMKIGFQTGISGEVINIGPDEGTVSINGLAQTISKLINFDLDPIYKLDRPLEVKNATCSADKARKLLGYETNYSLEKGLQEMINYIKSRGTKQFEYHLPIEIETSKTPETWTKKLF